MSDFEEEEAAGNPFTGDLEKAAPESDFVEEARSLMALPLSRRVWTSVLSIGALAIPVLSLQSFGYLSFAVDVAFLGHLGENELAAAGLAFAFQTCVSFIAWNLGTMGLYTMVGQAHGRGDDLGKGLALQTALIVSTIACVPVGILMFFSAPILGLNPYLDAVLKPFITTMNRLSIPGFVAETWYRVLEAALVNQRYLAPCVIIQLGCVFLNLFLNWLFIFRFGLGFLGSPLATSTMRAVRFIAAAIVVWGVPRIRRTTWTPWTRKSLSWPVVGAFLRHTVPAAVAVTLEIAGFEGLSFLATSFGPLASATHVTAFQALIMAFFVNFGVASAVNVAVANMLGAGQLDCALFYARVGGGLCFAVVSLNLVLLLALKNVLPTIFTDNVDVRVAAAALLVPWVQVVHVADSINFLVGSLLRATGRSRGATVSYIIGLFLVGVPCVFLFAFHLDFRLQGVWMALAVGVWATTGLLLFFLYRIDWVVALREATVNFHEEHHADEDDDL